MHTTFDPRRAGRPIVAVQGIGVDSFLTRYRSSCAYMARAALPGGGLFGDARRHDALWRGAAAAAYRRWPPSAAARADDRGDGRGSDQGRVSWACTTRTNVPVHHGLGWGKPTLMRDVPGSTNVFSHGGVSGTRLWVDPDAGLVFVFFTNRWGAERSVETEVLRGIYEAMLPLKP